MDKKYKCEICPKSYHTPSRLKLHIENSHSTFVCDICNKSFIGKMSLSGHKSSCGKSIEERKATKEKIGKIWLGKNHSLESRKKISEGRIKFLMENPDQVPYRLYHKSKGMNFPEKHFADHLREVGIHDWKYDFRVSIYTLDFAFEHKMIDLEIDGSTHELEKVKIKDKRRTSYLESLGWKVYRIKVKDLKKDFNKEFKKFLRFYKKLNV
jgi:very-short-patch-repair endonuclease/transposase-like protein